MNGPASVKPGSPAGWRACVPELVVTGVLAVTVVSAVYAFAGLGAGLIAVSLTGVVLLLGLRGLVPPASQLEPPAEPDRLGDRGQTSFFGFWRKRALLTAGSASMTAYDGELRETLQRLLAARLAERHGVNLYTDPAAARQVFLRGQGAGLWYWLDPDRPPDTDRNKRGIPVRTLSAILGRLEQL
jgi:hypothetical protein